MRAYYQPRLCSDLHAPARSKSLCDWCSWHPVDYPKGARATLSGAHGVVSPALEYDPHDRTHVGCSQPCKSTFETSVS